MDSGTADRDDQQTRYLKTLHFVESAVRMYVQIAGVLEVK